MCALITTPSCPPFAAIPGQIVHDRGVHRPSSAWKDLQVPAHLSQGTFWVGCGLGAVRGGYQLALILLLLLCFLGGKTCILYCWFCGEAGRQHLSRAMPVTHLQFPSPALPDFAVSSHFCSHPSHLQPLRISPTGQEEPTCTLSLQHPSGQTATIAPGSDGCPPLKVPA